MALRRGRDASADLLGQLERYYDTVPRAVARAEEVGPFTLFVSRGAWPLYARPRLGVQDFWVADVDRVRARQRELGVPESLEWVAEVTPALAAAARGSGLAVREHPLMVLDAPRPVATPAGIRVRMLPADDPALAAARAAVTVGFTTPGTQRGPAGAAERDASVRPDDPTVEVARAAIRAGLLAMAVAEDDAGVVGGGTHSPRGAVSEVTGVATLPAARRRGVAAAVTARLVGDALDRGIRTCLLSADSPEVARIYARVGFRAVGTACIAEPPTA